MLHVVACSVLFLFVEWCLLSVIVLSVACGVLVVVQCVVL